ncbi:Uu.00g015540.m01.CDS01 [Anthostomella pinea]|uniref:Uu.00g015540.m01.CDS01 n=1 Tax=Anthostomella pinea TaxID=933095 RepID=A0AAI8VZ44_9PEZI|nr:Uu.00g015540.m01.CDS01 [Anthostomella pinea]
MPDDGRRIPPQNIFSRLLSSLSNPSYTEMRDHDVLRPKMHPKNITLVVILSYVFDWAILIIVAAVGYILGNITPNKRPFSLQDPNISFPVTEHETVTSALLLVCNAVIPIAVILVVTLVFVPGPTVPEGTPKSLIWKRKLWELHIGWLGLALSLAAAWFITSGMKNLFGKPRPDLLIRCQPDVANVAKYIVGFATPADDGTLNGGIYNGQLVSGDICKNPDTAFLNDGFRSYPSGHSSSSAAGLIYLSLFLASKFAITLPFVPSGASSNDTSAVTAFPSRLPNRAVDTPYEAVRHDRDRDLDEPSSPVDPTVAKEIGVQNSKVLAVRRQAAAPPIYLLVITVLPFFLAIFVASSRWFDFRHHGFDILFGFIIGTITAFFAFRYYHLPISSGAGWAWGPRSHDKAFWAGLGSWSYATEKKHWIRPGDEDERMSGHQADDIELGVRQRSPQTANPFRERSNTTENPFRARSDSSGAIVHDGNHS